MIHIMLMRQMMLVAIFLIGYISTDQKDMFIEQLKQLGYFMSINLVFYGINHCLLWLFSTKYRTLDYDQRSYVVKNLTKSGFLAYIATYTWPHFFDIAFSGVWDNELLTYLGNLYVSTDLTGLLMVPSLSFNTQMHHTVVAVLGSINIICDYGNPGIHRAIVIMTYFSMLPYLVNTMLGLRHLKISNKFVGFILPLMCVSVYVTCIFANIVIQTLYVIFFSEYSMMKLLWPFNDFGTWERFGHLIKNTLFLTAYYVIILDDINLVEYLEYKAKIRVPLVKPIFDLIKYGIFSKKKIEEKTEMEDVIELNCTEQIAE